MSDMGKQLELKKTNRCVICGSIENAFFITKNDYSLNRCNSCDGLFVHPRPTQIELEKIYSFDAGYFINNKFNSNASRNKLTNKKINWITDNVSKLLDVGCGIGSYMRWSAELGVKCVGIDLNKDIVAYCQSEGLDVRNATLESFADSGERGFDAINLGDILEHVIDPSGFMELCNSLLNENGKVIITTPNKNCFFANYQIWLHNWFKIPCGHLTPPYHLTEFTDENLEKLLENRGFRVEEIHYTTISILYSFGATGIISKELRGFIRKRVWGKLIKFSVIKSALLATIVSVLYVIGYLIAASVNLFDRRKNSMTLFCVKTSPGKIIKE